jgi:hypothetical protein
MWRRLKRAMQIRQLAAGAAGLTLGLLLDFVSDWLKGAGAGFMLLVFALFLAALSVSVWLWWRDPGRVGLDLEPVKTLRSDAEKRQHARRGLVAFVSLYRPGPGSAAARLTPQDWRSAAEANDYARLDLANSNLATAIEAVTSHASRLEHCWLIGTIAADADIPGSQIYIPALIQYLRREKGLTCQFHHGLDLALSLDDDALVFDKTLDLIRAIFAQAGALELKAPDLIADFTGGIRSMTLGMILACLDGDRDIEMIGTRYSSEGAWVGPPFPIIFGFEPTLRQP